MTKGERIKKRRELLGFSQTELADLAEISKQTLFKYESNIVDNIPSNAVIKLASVLKTSPNYILGWDEVPDDETLAFAKAFSNSDAETKEMVRRILFYGKQSKKGKQHDD